MSAPETTIDTSDLTATALNKQGYYVGRVERNLDWVTEAPQLARERK